jgi:hypothetical protein
MPNLWPEDFGTITVTPPITILREQAEYLGKQTKGMVDGRVLTAKAHGSEAHWAPTGGEADLILKATLSPNGGDSLWHRFYVEVPALDDYRFLLFTVIHPLDLYPLRLYDNTADITYECNDQAEFEQRLRDILASDKTKKVISSILAQVQAVMK